MSSLHATTMFALSGGATPSAGTASLNNSLRTSMIVQTSGVQSLPNPPPGSVNSDIFIRVANTNADPDHNIMVLANAAPSSLPAYLSDAPVSIDPANPGIFPMGIQVGRDLYISRIADSVSFATGMVSIAPEQITGGADNLAGTTLALSTNSCPDMRDFTLASLQGSVDRVGDFKTSPLCNAAVIANGFEDRESVMTQNYREGGSVQVNNNANLVAVPGGTTATLLLDYLGTTGSAGTVPSWQTAPVTVSGIVRIAVNGPSNTTFINGTVVVTWGYISPVDGLVNLREQTYSSNARPGTLNNNHYVEFPQTRFNNPTSGIDGSGFSSVLLSVQLITSITGGGSFDTANNPSNFTITYHGRKPAYQENVSILGIVGGYEGRAMLRHNMSYEIQPTRETIPLIRSSLRHAHTTAERDNYLSVRNRLWGGSSSFTMLDNQIDSYIDILRSGKALSLYMQGMSPASFADSPANGTLTPYYSASSLRERVDHANRGGQGAVESLYQSLSDIKREGPMNNRIDSYTRPAPSGRYLASSKDSDWESFLRSPSVSESKETVQPATQPNNSKSSTDVKKEHVRVITEEVKVPVKAVYKAMMASGLAAPSSTKRKLDGQPVANAPEQKDTTVTLLPARVSLDPAVIKLGERKLPMPPPQMAFTERQIYHAMVDPEEADYKMGGERQQPDRKVSQAPASSFLADEMSEVSGEPPLVDLRLGGYTFTRVTTHLLRPVSTMLYVHHAYAGQAVSCLHPAHNFMKGRYTTSYQLFPAVYTDNDSKKMALMALILSIEPIGTTTQNAQTYVKIPVRQPYVFCNVHIGGEFTPETRMAIINCLTELFSMRPPVIGVDIYVTARGFSRFEYGIVADNSLLLALGLAYCGAPTIASTGALQDGVVGPVGDIGPKKACFSEDNADLCWKIPFAYPHNPASRYDKPWCRGVTTFASALDFAYASYAGAVFKDRNLPSTLNALAAYNEHSAVAKRRIFTKALEDVQTFYSEIQGETSLVNTYIGELASQTESLGTFRDKDVTAKTLEARLTKQPEDANQIAARQAEEKLKADRDSMYDSLMSELTARGYKSVTAEYPEPTGKFQGSIGRAVSEQAKERWGKVTSGENIIVNVPIEKKDLSLYRTGTAGYGAARASLAGAHPSSFDVHFGVTVNKKDPSKPPMAPVYWFIPAIERAPPATKTFSVSQKKKKKDNAPKKQTSIDERAIASFLAIPEITE